MRVRTRNFTVLISSYSFCGNYSRAETNQGRKLLIIRRLWLRKLFKGGNYSRAETIQGRKLFAEIRYIEVAQGAIWNRIWNLGWFLAGCQYWKKKRGSDWEQLFSADTTIYFFKSCCFMAYENIIALKSSILHSPVRNFQYYQPAQNQPKFHILFHKNGSPHNLCIMILLITPLKTPFACN